MKKFYDIIFEASPNDEKIFNQILHRLINTFPTFLKLSQVHTILKVTEFSILYYDLHYFLNKDIRKQKKYSIKDLVSFRNSFKMLFEKVQKVCELKDAYSLYIYEQIVDDLNELIDSNLEQLAPEPVE
jgi:hypothetical protein